MPASELSLVQRVRCGTLNFDRFVELMRTDGYIIDATTHAGGGFTRAAIDSINQEDFESLFNFFYPTEVLDIELSKAATDEGGQCGVFSSAVFNAKNLERQEVMALLRDHNKRFNR